MEGLHVQHFSVASVLGWLPQFVDDLSHSTHLSDAFQSSALAQLCAVKQTRCFWPQGMEVCPLRLSKPGAKYTSAEGSLPQGGGVLLQDNDAGAQSSDAVF